MVQRWPPLTPLLFLVFLVAQGCGDNARCVTWEDSLLILGNTYLDPDQCGPVAEENGPFVTRGVMDLAMTTQYVMHPTIQNPMRETVTLEGADVSLTAPENSGVVLPQNFFVPAAGTLKAGGLAISGIELVSMPLGSQIRQSPIFQARGATVHVPATVIFRGVTGTGREVESPEFTFPLEICRGCLLTFPPEAIALDADGSQTCNPAAHANPVVYDAGLPCSMGTDLPVDCRVCWAGFSSDGDAEAECDPM